MTALKMDGTMRKPRKKSPAAVVKAWFTANPASVVADHYCWAELPASSREVLASRRTAFVAGNRIVFAPFQSELSLRYVETASVTPEGYLRLGFAPGNSITYRAVP